MRLGIACDEQPLAPALLELLAGAGLDARGLGTTAVPALVPAGDDRWLLAAPEDVLTCLELGVLDAAVAGKDVLLELEPDVYELLDLRTGVDRLCWAAPAGGPEGRPKRRRPRVATRYPRLAARHFAARGLQVELVPFTGPVTTAVELGVADDVVELASRLAGACVVREELAGCSLRLVTGRAAHTLAAAALVRLTDALRARVEAA